MFSNMRTQLIIDALTIARKHFPFGTDGIIFLIDHLENSLCEIWQDVLIWLGSFEHIPMLDILNH